MATSRRVAALLLVLAVAGSCSDNDERPSAGKNPKDVLHAEVASYDIAAGENTRLIVGLFTGDELFVSYGTIDMSFAFLGQGKATASPEPGPRATGEFLLVPETMPPADPPERPIAAPASRGRGVYAAHVTLDRPGFWEVTVRADVEGRGQLVATGAFEVLEEHRVPAPGEPALKTENLTRTSTDAPRAAVDSRWGKGQPLPDPELHTTSISDAIRAHRPALVVFSTPVYCVSRFCGPITDMVQDLAHDYGDRAEFIHVEIWRNFENSVINKGAADWLLRDDDLREPWVFLIGRDGIIDQRWDNVATQQEIEPFLKRLPKLE
jgi:hypothetical protein